MCIYVKFGVGWALHKKGAYAYLSNALTSNVYILDQDKVLYLHWTKAMKQAHFAYEFAHQYLI